jgi:hypothetical protein
MSGRVIPDERGDTKGLARPKALSEADRDAHRLKRIREIIEGVHARGKAPDGPVIPIPQEMQQEEISAVYALACRHPESWRPK